MEQYIMNTRKLSAFAAKYKYVLIILLAGLILLLLPTGSRTKAKTAQAAADTAADDPGRGAAPDNAPAADQRRGTSAGAAVLPLLGRAGAGDGR